MTSKEERFLAGLVPPSNAHTSEGKGVFKELIPFHLLLSLISRTFSLQVLQNET